MPKFLDKRTFTVAFYVAASLLVLTLTGIFDTFADREVIEDTLTLATSFLYLALFLAGLVSALRSAAHGIGAAVLSGIIGAVFTGTGIALLTLLAANVDLSFVFRNLGRLHPGAVTFGQESLETGIVLLLLVSVIVGALAGVVAWIPARIRNVGLLSILLTLTLGILQGQIDSVIALADALLLLIAFALGYGASRVLGGTFTRRAIIGLIPGVVIGVIAVFMVQANGLARDSLLRGVGSVPELMELAVGGNLLNIVVLVITAGGAGVLGALVTRSPHAAHNGAWYFVVGLVLLGLLNWYRGLTVLSAVISLILLIVVLWFASPRGAGAEGAFFALPRPERRRASVTMSLIMFVILLAAPLFIGQSLSNTLNLVMLYVIMGIGLNVMVGYAGLLDLGYVASFAFGAYTTGLLTAPSMLTCGGQSARQIVDAGLRLSEACSPMSFWAALPFAIIVSAITGMMLGVPVLRLRGDYLAIVTLGFGEIANRILKSDTFKDLLGGPQGLSPIPVPFINLNGVFPNIELPALQLLPATISDFFTSIRIPEYRYVISFSRATDIYYLYLAAVIIIGFIVLRLVNTRVGRAWRAVREDEDVAEAMGIHLVKTKLLAFGVSSALAGVGGAIFGASLQGVFPDSFVLVVSINVLSIVIIGGMGSIPGVFVGALILVGMPEVLREVQDYRLLVFGALLVATMLLKSQGLLPPEPPKLSQEAGKSGSAQLQGAGD